MYSDQDKTQALRVLSDSAATSNEGIPVWGRCSAQLGIHRSTLKRWWKTYGLKGEGREEEEKPPRVGRMSARELLNCSAQEAHEVLLQLALDAYEDAESDAGRTGALKEISRLTEAHGRKDEGSRTVSPGEWVEMARECPELLYEAVLGCETVLGRLGLVPM